MELETPDINARIAILRKKQEHLLLQLPDDVLQFLAGRIRSNIRRLEGALIRVASYSSLTGRELTREALEYLWRDTLGQEQQKQQEQLSIGQIQRTADSSRKWPRWWRLRRTWRPVCPSWRRLS